MDNKHNVCCKPACTLNWFDAKQITQAFNSFRFGFIVLILLTIFSFDSLHSQNISFSKTTLLGTNLSEPTSLQFGPDGRLYVSERTGDIFAYTVAKNGNNYQVLATETIDLVKNIPNHEDDDGSFTAFVTERQVTGILIVGTAANPIIYASSSDVRIGGGGGSDTGLDTNSGMISRLTYNGTSWSKVDLIRGLPRSEENHATNGMQYDAVNNILIVAQGGNTNAGAPSANFDHLNEYALSAAILNIDLTMIDNMPVLTDPNSGQQYIYDIPTLDDPTRPNVNGKDINDPFGGNDGLNQAKFIPGGPISLFSTGYRNQYDVVLTELGFVYTWDNGPNGGIGGHPENEGSPNVTNNWVPGEPGSNGPGPNDAKVNNLDGLHKVTQGYYAGHPTPIRANPLGAGLFTHVDGPSETGTFRTAITGNPATTLPVDWPPYPDALKDLREADFQNPGVSDGSIFTWPASTNGMVEYTANTFGGAMKGDLLAVSFSGDVLRVDLDANGDLGPDGVTSIGNQLGIPLDVTSLPNNAQFAGTIWVAEFSGNSIAILEPTNNNTCLGTNDNTIDEDGDGYTNADEIQNGSDPCNPAINPPDFDKTLIGAFKVSNLNDPDDDDDGMLDNVDPFAQDAFNGLNTTIPLTNRLANGTSGLLDLGFTGLMTNGTTDYLDLISNENDIIAGGAPELLVIPGVTDGVALNGNNDEVNAFQFGIKVDNTTPSFTVSGKIVPPFLGTPPTNNQQHGIYIGTGDQDNYVKIVLHALNGFGGGVQVIQETNGVATIDNHPFPSALSAAELKLSLSINPANGDIQPMFSINGSNSFPLGSGPLSTSGSLLNAIQNTNIGLAVGITASSIDAGNSFTAIWDDINILFNDPNALTGQWETINDGNNCAALGNPGSCPTQRHESAYIEVGDKFYVVGGRETNTVNIYDPITDVWTEGATAPINLHHFQSIEYQGLIYVMGAFTGTFPNDAPVPNIYIYDPASDTWTEGPEIPIARRRGAAAAVNYKGKIYLAGGIQNGHTGGRVSWLDEYDPKTNTWTILADAPNDRDHVQAVIFDDKLYLVAGKQTNLGGNLNATVPIVDVFDFDTQTWSSLPNPIPTPRGGASVALLGNEILAIGGESTSSGSLVKTEALNLDDNTWRILPNLIQGRHGTQAVVNNGVIYIAVGSPIIGGGNSNTQEVFYFTQKNVPVLASIAQSVIAPEGDNLNALNTLQFVANNEQIKLKNTTGNQGIIITDISLLAGSSPTFSFTLMNNVSLPLVLAAGDSLDISINNSNPDPTIGSGALIISHSGVNAPQTSIILNEPICVDNDGDGFCVNEDCNDNDALVPTTPGTPCNDGNPNTTDDVILADGCTCQGSGGVIADCNGVLFIGGNGEIIVDNLLATSEILEIIGSGTGYNVILICDGDCDDTQVIPNLLPGDYNVKLNMFGSDNSYCYREETVTVLSGPCTDVDNDGVCANVDCDDNDASIPTTPGTVCDDGNPATTNDVYLADGCTCEGTIPCPTDADGDGVCFDVDCDDNDPSIPTTPGTACDDGDINTVGDVIQADGCTCMGSNGGPANCMAIQFTGGVGQITIANLTAASEIVELIGAPTNWQIVPVCNGDCANTEVIPNLAPGIYTVKINMFGDDNSHCYTQQDVVVLDGPCTDVDGDGVCEAEDCDDNDPSIPTAPGTSCNDGDPNTTGDVIQADGCTCQGTFQCPIDVDGDGVCSDDDCNDNDASIPTTPGTACNDGDPNTINDVIQADGCTCAGTICTDADNDGVCSDEDCDDNDPSLPTTPGSICDDGDPNTTGDVYQADGCTCAGIGGGPANCDNVQFIGGNGIITLMNLTSASEQIEIIGAATNWIPVLICAEADPCANPYIIMNLSPGLYTVKLQMFGDDNTYCYRQEDVTVTDTPCTDADGDGVCANIDCDDNDAALPTTPGTTCDDGNAATTNDVILADGCTCQGTLPCPIDADGDGVCSDVDCDDNDATVPTAPGTACDDGNPNTQGDVIQADGCTCAGSTGGPANCDNVQFNGGAGEITLTNLTALGEKIEIIGAGTNWQIVVICDINCNNPQVIPNLAAGTYTVKIQMFGDDNSYCYRQEDVVVTAPSLAPAALNRSKEVLAFTAYSITEAVEIEWMNNTSYKNDLFVVERAGEGTDFEPILEYNAAGNTDELKRYIELDANPLEGMNYYRLKLIYEDGTYEYSPTQQVNFSKLPDFGIYPNPAKEMVFLDLKQYLDRDVDISIKDQLGRTIYEKYLPKIAEKRHQISLNNFDEGLYIIQIKTAGKQLIAKKLMVAKLH